MARKKAEPAPEKKIEDAGARYEHRVEVVLEMMNAFKRKSEIKKELKKRFGIQFRQAENYIREAKNRQIKQIQAGADEMRAGSYGFYRSVVEDATLPIRERLRAQECIDNLLGLKSPIKVANTDTKGNDIGEKESAVERLAKLAAKLANPGESVQVEPGRTGGAGGSASGT